MQYNWLKFVRFYLDTTIKLCRLNPAGELDGFGPSLKLAHLPVWSHLIDLFYVYFALKLLICQLLQHNYNVIKHALNTTMLEEQSHSGAALERAKKQAQLVLAEARINSLGNAFYELGFSVEPLFVYMLIIIYLIYVHTRLFVALRCPVEFGFVRMLLAPERERAVSTDRQIEYQVNQFVVSSRNFMLASREQLSTSQSDYLSSGVIERSSKQQLKHQQLDLCHLRSFELLCAHERATSELRELLRSGELVPPNRRAEQVEHMARVYGTVVLSTQNVGFWSVIIFVFVLPWSGWLSFKPRREFIHLLFQVELICHGLIGVQHLTFYLCNGFMAAYEQLLFVRKLSSMSTDLTEDTCFATINLQLDSMRKLRKTTSHRGVVTRSREISTIASMTTSGGGHSAGQADLTITGASQAHQTTETRVERLNKRLIRTLILYKLLLGQMRSTQPVLGFIGAHITLIMLVVPMLNRIYVAYLTNGVKWVMISGALVVIISCDSLLLPNWMLYARCLDLFRSMSRLLGHIDAHLASEWRTGETTSSRIKLAAYDEHTVWLLRREQNSPELALKRFATDAHFLHLTYSSFLGVHFWCGLLLAPMFLRHDTVHSSQSRGLFADSLRLF